MYDVYKLFILYLAVKSMQIKNKEVISITSEIIYTTQKKFCITNFLPKFISTIIF